MDVCVRESVLNGKEGVIGRATPGPGVAHQPINSSCPHLKQSLQETQETKSQHTPSGGEGSSQYIFIYIYN